MEVVQCILVHVLHGIGGLLFRLMYGVGSIGMSHESSVPELLQFPRRDVEGTRAVVEDDVHYGSSIIFFHFEIFDFAVFAP